MDDGLQNLQIRCAGERPASGDHLVEHHSERENIASGTQRVTRRLLRRHVGEGANHHARPREPFRQRTRCLVGSGILRQLRQTEVRQLCIAAPGDQNIIGLDVAMHNVSSMRRGQSVGDTNQQLDDLPAGALVGSRPLLERAAIDVLRNQVLASCILTHVVNCHYVGMIERRRHLRLPLETAAGRGVGQIGEEKLDRHKTIKTRVASLEDLAHAPRTDGCDDLVGAEFVAY